ncbi:BTAD domain-containing putative transcriptional regulator [Streptomyces sp. NPDC059002]|uniref:BTAD domain-containing putative transcriptional regulator n=1 Tax=Streptomyces sp. NPDC059002 TaxID=3346690 RepID=UPI0036AF9AD7
MVKICVLGPLTVEVDGERAELGGPLPRGVFALLLAARGDVVPADRLIEHLWRGCPPPSAPASLQAYIARLRRALEPTRPPRTEARLLVSAPPGYALRISDPEHTVDAWQFERQAQTARALLPTRPQETVRLLEAALRLWAGPAYAEFADETWAADESARLGELRHAARETLAAARLRCAEPGAAVAEAETLTREQPLREEGWRLLALALWGSGRQGDALAALRRARARLGEELGIDPGPRLVELEEAVLHQRHEVLHLATRPPSPEPSLPSTGLPSTALPSTALPSTVPPPPSSPPSLSPLSPAPAPLTAGPLLGRDAELTEVSDAAARARGGEAQLVLLSGEAGIGKSSILEQVERQLPQQGWLVATGHCPETEGAPPGWAWLDLVHTLAAAAPPGPYATDLAPLLEPGAGSATAPDGSPAQRFRLHRALLAWLETVAAHRPLALLLDDLHRADQETVELFVLCAERLRRAPVLLVAAYRPDEGDLTGPLSRLARRSPSRLALRGLLPPQAQQLLESACPVPVSDRAAAALVERTGGNPFYLRESSRLLAAEGEQAALAEVPQGVLDVVRRRIARLEPADTTVLRLMAVSGRQTRVDVLVAAADTDEGGVLDALDAGVAAGLLSEPSPGLVRFCHALVRDALEADLTRLRRARMHSRLGRSLVALGSDDVAATAHHFLRACAVAPADAVPAVSYARRAADQAVNRYAPRTGELLLEEALDCLERHRTAFTETDTIDLEVALLARLVHCRIRLGAITGAQQARTRAVELAREHGRDDLMIAAYSAWTEPTSWLTRNYGTTDTVAVADLVRLLERTTLEPRTRCLLLDQLAATRNDADHDSRQTARQALALARDLSEPRLLAQTLATLVRLTDFELDADVRLELTGELAVLARAYDLPEHLWIAEYGAASIATVRNGVAAVHRHLDRADEIARTYGLGGAGAVGMLRHVMLAMAQGRYAAAEQAMAEAVAALRDQGALAPEALGDFTVLCIRLQQGRVAEALPLALALSEQYRPLHSAITALALLAAGEPDRARQVFARRAPIRRDYCFSLFATLDAMAAVALGDREAAAGIYQELLPLRDVVAGAVSLSIALRPVALSLGELALLLDRPQEAEGHFTRAEQVAHHWNAPHWSDAARTALASLSAVG